jgi:hypothetical protein
MIKKAVIYGKVPNRIQVQDSDNDGFGMKGPGRATRNSLPYPPNPGHYPLK